MPKIKELLTPKQERAVLKQRVQALGKLPKGWLREFVIKHTEYNNYDGIILVQNVANLRSSDKRITELLERKYRKLKKAS